MLPEAIITPDDVLKLKAAALYIMEKFDVIGFHKLFKILYFADQDHYANYGRRIIKDKFCSMEAGPVPSNLYNAIHICQGKRTKEYDPLLTPISDAIEVYYVGPKNHYVRGLEKPDMDELSLSDIECIDRSIRDNRSLGFKALKIKSHDLAWNDGNRNHHNIINPLLMAKAAGSSDDMLDYLAEMEHLEAILA